MNRTLFVALLFCTTTILYAGQATVSQADNHRGICASWEDIARAAMTARQAGVPLKIMLSLVSDETSISIFRLAYESPRLKIDTDRQASITNFISNVVSQCQASSKNQRD